MNPVHVPASPRVAHARLGVLKFNCCLFCGAFHRCKTASSILRWWCRSNMSNCHVTKGLLPTYLQPTENKRSRIYLLSAVISELHFFAWGVSFAPGLGSGCYSRRSLLSVSFSGKRSDQPLSFLSLKRLQCRGYSVEFGLCALRTKVASLDCSI